MRTPLEWVLTSLRSWCRGGWSSQSQARRFIDLLVMATSDAAATADGASPRQPLHGQLERIFGSLTPEAQAIVVAWLASQIHRGLIVPPALATRSCRSVGPATRPARPRAVQASVVGRQPGLGIGA